MVPDQIELCEKLLDTLCAIDSEWTRQDLPGPGDLKDALDAAGLVILYDNAAV